MADTVQEQLVIPGLEPHCSPVPEGARRRLALDEGRAKALEDIYQASGRSNPAHPLHGLFTGLWTELCLATGRALLEHALLNPSEVQIFGAMSRPTGEPVQESPPEGLLFEEACAIREQAHADAAESIRLQQEANRLRSRYFHGLAALHGGAFVALGNYAG